MFDLFCAHCLTSNWGKVAFSMPIPMTANTPCKVKFSSCFMWCVSCLTLMYPDSFYICALDSSLASVSCTLFPRVSRSWVHVPFQTLEQMRLGWCTPCHTKRVLCCLVYQFSTRHEFQALSDLKCSLQYIGETALGIVCTDWVTPLYNKCH